MDKILFFQKKKQSKSQSQKNKKIWPLQNGNRSFLCVAPPLTFIWRCDRRLDKSTQASPKYEPIEQSGREQETSKVLNLFPKKSFWHYFWQRSKLLWFVKWRCVLQQSHWYSLSRSTDVASLVLKACCNSGKIQRPPPHTSASIHSQQRKKLQKKHCCEKGLRRAAKSIIHNMIQPLLQMQGGHHGVGGGLGQSHAFQSALSYEHAHFAHRFVLQGSSLITYPLNLSHKGTVGNIT